VQSDNGEFSIEMPADPVYFYDPDGFYFNGGGPTGPYNFKEMQMLNASLEKTYMSVEIYSMLNPKTYLNEFTERKEGFENH